MSFICVIGPGWNNLQLVLHTISKNRNILPGIKKIYIPTNDDNTLRYFTELNDPSIICTKFADNEGHQTACFNAIIFGMKMIIEHEDDNEDDIVIFSHEDVFILDLSLFYNAVQKFQRGYDMVCRMYLGSKNTIKGPIYDTYCTDAFLIKKNKVKDIFQDVTMKQIIYPETYCEREFTSIIQNHNVFSFPYYNHCNYRDSELGFHHIFYTDRDDEPFWDKSNIQEIYNM